MNLYPGDTMLNKIEQRKRRWKVLSHWVFALALICLIGALIISIVASGIRRQNMRNELNFLRAERKATTERIDTPEQRLEWLEERMTITETQLTLVSDVLKKRLVIDYSESVSLPTAITPKKVGR